MEEKEYKTTFCFIAKYKTGTNYNGLGMHTLKQRSFLVIKKCRHCDNSQTINFNKIPMWVQLEGVSYRSK